MYIYIYKYIYKNYIPVIIQTYFCLLVSPVVCWCAKYAPPVFPRHHFPVALCSCFPCLILLYLSLSSTPRCKNLVH